MGQLHSYSKNYHPLLEHMNLLGYRDSDSFMLAYGAAEQPPVITKEDTGK
jgi:hypothetical protein